MSKINFQLLTNAITVSVSVAVLSMKLQKGSPTRFTKNCD
ncbi:hypothetical protein LEP1GSC195_0679 [Leptospira wolbachii serovar Codice str. CDC]|uniref:Uncharacterized protein n=1 Tax=Leptospira wolbachii serovar Codice str. CDC TaxID=1218599 RepID=R8ZY43_9LEPT|nr:hypothetical protein LEP1GSC195_0679 [Leptospira wolbachii serovar Codice str. CDC]